MADLADLTQAIEAGNRAAAATGTRAALDAMTAACPPRRPTVSGQRAAGQRAAGQWAAGQRAAGRRAAGQA